MERKSESSVPWKGFLKIEAHREEIGARKEWEKLDTQPLPNLDEVFSISLFTYFVDTLFKILFVKQPNFYLKIQFLRFLS